MIPVAAARTILTRMGRAGGFTFDGAFFFDPDDARGMRTRMEDLIRELSPCPKCGHGSLGGHSGERCGGRYSSGVCCRCTFDQRRAR